MGAPTAVIQVKRGIGDVMWHLAFIRAIAAISPGGTVTFLAPPSSGARELLTAEPYVAEVIYFEHFGSELQRGVNLMRLVALLRRHRFHTLWILDRTIRPALAAFVAGIPERLGLGLGAQKLFITNAGIDQSHFHDHPIDWLRALMGSMKVPLPTTEPALRLPDVSVAAIAEKFKGCPRPWIVLGVGASLPTKDWPDRHWTDFVAILRGCTSGTVFLIGGGANFDRSQNFIADGAGALAVNACDLGLMEAAALLRHADIFVGPNSGPLNLAAATGTEAFGLFGPPSALTYSKFIHAVGWRHGADSASCRAGAHQAVSIFRRATESAAAPTGCMNLTTSRRPPPACGRCGRGWRVAAACHPKIKQLWLCTLRRRSQKDRTTWERIKKIAVDYLSKQQALHPWPEQRFAVTHPRREPQDCRALGCHFGIHRAEPVWPHTGRWRHTNGGIH
jgi:heptosyltransferase-2